MKGMQVQHLPGPAICQALPGLFLLSIMLLSGCATGGKSRQEPAAQITAPLPKAAVVATGPVVEPLPEGRQGFVIREIPGMDAEAQRDFAQATVLLQEQNYAQAITLLQKVIERSPAVSAPYINLAKAYRHVGQPEPAEKHLKKALELIPEHPVASNEYGLLLRKTGRFAEARAIYEKSLAVFPDYMPARRNLGILCDLYLNDPACALQQYKLYSEAKPADEQVKIWIADLSVRMGQ